jgi:hypothetical protein
MSGASVNAVLVELRAWKKRCTDGVGKNAPLPTSNVTLTLSAVSLPIFVTAATSGVDTRDRLARCSGHTAATSVVSASEAVGARSEKRTRMR